eukprot:scaffold5581_cov229-Prasinococcus_capsulatus_cf.AAC.2
MPAPLQRMFKPRQNRAMIRLECCLMLDNPMGAVLSVVTTCRTETPMDPAVDRPMAILDDARSPPSSLAARL